MKLLFVTWDLDFTQFLVEADNDTEAIKKSIEAHEKYDEDNWGKRDPDDEEDAIFLEDMHDPSTYSVDPVDFKLLDEIIKYRDDYVGMYGEAIVFFGA